MYSIELPTIVKCLRKCFESSKQPFQNYVTDGLAVLAQGGLDKISTYYPQGPSLHIPLQAISVSSQTCMFDLPAQYL